MESSPCPESRYCTLNDSRISASRPLRMRRRREVVALAVSRSNDEEERSTSLTHDVVSELVLADVVEQRSEDGQQSVGGVADVLGHTFNLQEHKTQI